MKMGSKTEKAHNKISGHGGNNHPDYVKHPFSIRYTFTTWSLFLHDLVVALLAMLLRYLLGR